jgi:hypothetical protein
MTTPKVMIAVPAYTGQIPIGMFKSMLHDIIAMRERGWNINCSDVIGGAEIDTIRNAFFAAFLRGDYTHLVMIDSDLMWDAGGIMRLIDAGEDFVAGLYPKRQYPITYPAHLKAGNRFDMTPTGLIEVDAVPGGFVCITRRMAKQMVAKYGHLRYVHSSLGPAWDVFGKIRDGEERLSEDLSFCKRWRGIGGKIYVVPDLQMGHVGQHVFTGRFGEVQERAA